MKKQTILSVVFLITGIFKNTQASEFKNIVKSQSPVIANDHHQSYQYADGSGVIKLSNHNSVRKIDTIGNTLDIKPAHQGWKELKVVNKENELLGRYDINPQGEICYKQNGVPVEDKVLLFFLTELVSKLDAIPVPENL
ncbi:hypothetical protein [Candidatus Chromulinivorax destructor]|uniref:Uncharacterized protein n=1 Tax=Candidatus Chromulinivorax destructor TaxID=2066483 RepID=A0A345ZC60_9BACT|nr:hypothetical protein [Candidatus Chromulinivorax destructor]AXK60877.1 hypothetical protein C0J27_03980 [Candidatus Chromulinivorax destructor]